MARVSFAGLKRLGIALAWIVLFAVIGGGIIAGVASVLPNWGGPTWFVARTGVYELLGFGTATLVVGRLLSKHSWDAMGWRRPGLGRHLARGVGLGALMAAIAVGLAALLDGARVSMSAEWGQVPSVVLPLTFGLVCAALAEELAFRGYPLRRLAQAVGPAPAILVFAMLFGLAHSKNPSATSFSTLNVGLAAVWLSVAFFSAGGMALAWGLHFGWNAGLALFFDAPVSGYAFHVPVVEYAPGPHTWVDGGAFGPEGGIVATLVIIAGTAALIWPRLKRPMEPLAA
jgi:membrane protease YdiL (CAAX protease family)